MSPAGVEYLEHRAVDELGSLDVFEGLVGGRDYISEGGAAGDPEVVGAGNESGHGCTCPDEVMTAVAGSPFPRATTQGHTRQSSHQKARWSTGVSPAVRGPQWDMAT